MQTMEITRCQYMPGMTRGQQQQAGNEHESGGDQVCQLPPGHQGIEPVGTDLDAPVDSFFSTLGCVGVQTRSSSSFCWPKSPDGLRMSVRMMASSATIIW